MGERLCWSSVYLICVWLLQLVACHAFLENRSDPYAAYDGKYLVKVTACNKAAVDVLKAAVNGTDCVFLSEEGAMQLPKKGCGEESLICSKDAASQLVLEDGGKISSKDAGKFFREAGGTAQSWDSSVPHASNEFYSRYRDLPAIESKVQELVDDSGGIAKIEELSPPTHEGRRIKAVRIRGSGWKSGGPRVMFNFNIHAREWISGMTGVYTLEYFLRAVKQDRNLISGMEVVLVPMSNPDGFDYSTKSQRFWRKNRRKNGGRCDGVDLNRNWDQDWGGRESTSRSACSDIYIGTSARSEPESKALGKLIEEAPLLVHCDVHAFSEVILGPWSYSSRDHPQKRKIDELGKIMQAAVKRVHGKTYGYGTGDELLYLASGVFPDFSTSKGAYGYTYELRPKNGRQEGFAPPANQILPTAEEAFQGLLSAIKWAGGGKSPSPTPSPPRRRSSPGPPRRRSSPGPPRRRSSPSPPGRVDCGNGKQAKNCRKCTKKGGSCGGDCQLDDGKCAPKAGPSPPGPSPPGPSPPGPSPPGPSPPPTPSNRRRSSGPSRRRSSRRRSSGSRRRRRRKGALRRRKGSSAH